MVSELLPCSSAWFHVGEYPLTAVAQFYLNLHKVILSSLIDLQPPTLLKLFINY